LQTYSGLEDLKEGYYNQMDLDQTPTNLEHLILGQTIFDDGFAKTVLPHITKDLFPDGVDQIIYGLIDDHVAKYKKTPNKEALDVELGQLTNINEEQFDKASNVIAGLHPTENGEWILDKAEKWTANRLKQAEFINVYRLDHPDLTKLQSAINFSFKEKKSPLLKATDFSMDYWDSFENMVDPIIPSGPAIGLLAGRRSTGKTFVTLNMLGALSSGRRWMGRPTVKVNSLYVSGEGSDKISKRVLAHMRYHKEDFEKVRFLADHWYLGEGRVYYDMAKKYLMENEIGFLVLDTLSQMLKGSDSDDAVAKRFVQATGDLSNETGCTIMIPHHPNKYGTAKTKGSGDWENSVDFVLNLDDVTDDENVVPDPEDGHKYLVLTCQKSRDDDDGWKVPLCLKPYTLIENNKKGHKVSTLVVVDTDKININTFENAKKKKHKLNDKSGQVIYDALKHQFSGLCASKKVLTDHILKTFEQNGDDRKPDTIRRGVVDRGVQELLDEGLLTVQEKTGFLVLDEPTTTPF
jgi:AAA domain